MSDHSKANGIEWKPIKVTKSSMRVTNPIRDIVDRLIPPKDHTKSFLSLSIGDPTVFGNLKAPMEVQEALKSNIETHKFDGYAHAAGYTEVRSIIAEKHSYSGKKPLSEQDVIITSGGSGALEIIINVLAESTSNMLIPSPGFSLYQTLLAHRGAEARYYRLDPKRKWEVDLDHLESLIDSNTCAILINNPSNPCGSVYSKEHLLDILKVAEKHHLSIISDEIYGKLVWDNNTFYPIASLTSTVPVLSVAGLAKMYICPGWRLGWITIHDEHGLFSEVRTALNKQTQLILGASTLVQSIVPVALQQVPQSYHDELTATLSKHSEILCTRLANIPGVTVVRPGGAMYLMIGITPELFEDIDNDVDFAKGLLTEENLSLLPGTIFTCPNYLRIVICAPAEKLNDACDRIESFCLRHAKK